MTEKKTGRRGCFKYGCFGCLGLTALGLVAAGAIALMALTLGPPEQEFVDPDLTRALPGAGDDTARGLAGGEVALGPGPPGRVVLDLAGGEFHVRPGAAGEPVRITGNYNRAAFALVEELERDDSGGWSWKIRFRRNVSWMRMLHGDQYEQNRLEIVLPPDVPFRLEGAIRTGISRIELGGLELLGVDLDLSMGEHRIGFSSALPRPLERFDLDLGMGEFSVDGLGHASPAAVRIDGRMGELRVDLDGDWRNDATVAARWRMGACRFRVPDDVRVDADDVTVFMGGAATPGLRGMPQLPADAPALRLDLAATMGEVRVVR